MAQLTDSTRRLLIFIAIVAGGSILLVFDIPVLYLMIAVMAIAFLLLIITGTLILSEFIRDLRARLKSRRPKPKKKKPAPAVKQKEGKAKSSFSIGNLFKGFTLPKPSLKKKETKKPKKSSTKEEKTTATVEESNAAPADEMDDLEKELADLPEDETGLPGEDNAPADEDLLDGLDLDGDIDIDAELESVNPEFDSVRTPFSDESALDELPTEDQVKKMDISTKEEEDDIVLDTDDNADEIDEIYSSTYDVGSEGGGDVISSMEGGDSISSSDLASYGSSDETPYDYGGEGSDSGGEEQFELSPGGKGGVLGDDDLIASLKADISDMNKKDDDVLLRDLKDIHVTAEDLNDELKEIIDIITRKAKMK